MSRPSELRTEPVKPAASSRTRRAVLKAGGTLLLSVFAPLPARAAQILAVRVWPAEDYTRVTLENDSNLKASHFIVKDPERLVVDIEGLELNPTLKQLVAKIEPNDPYIRNVRVGQNRPNVVRLVFDLKEEVNPQVFTLAPIGEYRHRLIFDLYPVNPPDPIAALIAKGEWGNDKPADPTPPGADARTEAPPAATATHPEAQTAKTDPREDKPAVLTRMITIALDPGHGGEDPGAIGRAGSREKDVVLSIAKRLKGKIEGQPNMRVMLTRDADYFVPLHVRVQKARKVQADLFVSIHADAWIESTARGSSVFVLSEKGASSTAARWLANKENAADLIGGVNIKVHDRQLARVLLDLSTTAQINDSLKLAKAVLGEIGGINRLHKAAVEQAGFAVLKAPDIPSILIETAFISNPEEEAKLTDDAYQDKMADAVLKGIRKYFAKNPPLAKNRMT
ncbi:MAG TPA: N-acetylmuramoyl-L-alanine amidase [Noviherbaspirillum sp.]|uniref:N-acetylmuramoyl-L-alanine amidase n=1 Tax=Noviherbaspirillum sp. TaxID=1926288 RepID=UPI002B4A73C0|nr:N-acetylmuramoyl-L-alanine amidase [Noviherbaspirillum sp.]HJV86611.1 N-acetylmuramoyl-L-alanine amidase [Noviherbaspirillum sp.]